MALTPRVALLAAALLAPAALVGCGSGGGMGKALLQSVRPGADAAAGPATAAIPRAEIESVGVPVMRVRVPAMGIDVLMVQRDVRGAVTTWVTNAGQTFAFRDGVLIETRGLGADLMSAAAPSPGQLASGAGHSRSYFFIGPEDRTQRRDYACQPEERGAETVAIFGRGYATRHVAESCQRAEGRITNDFWLQGGTVRKSRQWVSSGAGYAEFERITD